MRLIRTGLSGLIFSFVVFAVTGCGGGGHARSRAALTQTPAPAPTPDTTPIEALRTPAGLILKTGPESNATRPATTPSLTPTKGPSVS